MAPTGSRDNRQNKGRLWRKIDAFNSFMDGAVPYIAHVDALVWLALFRHARDGRVTRSNGRLAIDINVSERTVRRAIERLKRNGLLRVERRGGLRVGASTFAMGVRDLRPKAKPSPRVVGQLVENPQSTGHGCPVIADTAVTDITDDRAAPGPDGHSVPQAALERRG